MADTGPSQETQPDLAEIDVIEVLHALADPVRLNIVRQLAQCAPGAGLSCSKIELPVSKSTSTHHFKILTKAGILNERCEGTRKYMSLRKCDLDRHFPGLLDSVLGSRPQSG